MFPNYCLIRGIAAGLVFLASALGARPNPSGKPVAVTAKLSEWKVQLSAETVTAGPVAFTVTNSGSIPHALEVEGQGLEQQTVLLQPGSSTTLTLTLGPGTYEVYCPVGEDSHKKLGMETHLKVMSASGSRSPGYADIKRTPSAPPRAIVPAIEVAGGGPVIQILPGPFPF